MIQDIMPSVYHVEYSNELPVPEACLIGVEGRSIYMKKVGENLEFLRFRDLCDENNLQMTREICSKYCETVNYLFKIDETSFFLVDPTGENREELLNRIKNIEDVVQVGMGDFRGLRPIWKSFAGVTAMQLNSWYQNRRYCGRCGNVLTKSQTERAMVCPECGLIEYPKISPAVIIGITHGDRLLMTKYADRDFKKYALVAGFTEIGEDFEATVRREVMEEVGLKVKNITYYKSQPWSFSDTILAGFFCQLDGSDEYHIDTNELAIAEWLTRDQLPRRDSDIALTSDMIEAFRTKTYPMYEEWEEKKGN